MSQYIVKVSELSDSEVKQRLSGDGLRIIVGGMFFCLKTPLTSIAKNVSILYKDYVLLEDQRFVDFHVSISSPNILSRLILKQAQFYSDGFAPFNPLPIQHAPALIEWGMNWCVSSQINTHLIIHAAVIEKSGFAAIMPAPPGSGKSTLTASLIQEGWRLLSDELTLIRIDNGLLSPFPRPVSLKNQSIDVIKQRYPNVVFGVLSTDTMKGTVAHIRPPQLSVELQGVECPVGWIVFPKYEEGANTDLSAKPKAQSLMDVADNSFNYSRLGAVGFETLKKVIDGADCYQFRYSRLDEAVATFAALEPPR